MKRSKKKKGNKEMQIEEDEIEIEEHEMGKDEQEEMKRSHKS